MQKNGCAGSLRRGPVRKAMLERPTPVNYLRIRPDNFRKEYSHLLLLLFWPMHGLFFYALERLYKVDDYIEIYSPLDDLIVFNEWFVLPYLFWFVFLFGMHVYTLLFDVAAFKRMMYFTIFTYGVTLVIYLLFPTCQNLRPETFARDNFLTRFMAAFYRYDTNTNVCPSIHVLGSFAVQFASLDTKRFRTIGWQVFFIGTTLLICLSTVHLKQHSVLDVFAALPLCAIGYFLFYRKKKARQQAA